MILRSKKGWIRHSEDSTPPQKEPRKKHQQSKKCKRCNNILCPHCKFFHESNVCYGSGQEGLNCPCCSANFCEDCSEIVICGVCGNSHCRDCLSKCSGCGAWCCQNGQVHAMCSGCDSKFYQNCFYCCDICSKMVCNECSYACDGCKMSHERRRCFDCHKCQVPTGAASWQECCCTRVYCHLHKLVFINYQYDCDYTHTRMCCSTCQPSLILEANDN